MTTTEEQLAMMDWLRANGGIGVSCGGEDELLDHLPEYCVEERQEYLDYFEIGLRKAGPAGERAYFAIREAAKTDWWLLHAEDYEGQVMQGRVQAYLDSATATGFAGPTEVLGSTGGDPAGSPGNGTKHSGGIMGRFRPMTPLYWALLGMSMAIMLDFFLDWQITYYLVWASMTVAAALGWHYLILATLRLLLRVLAMHQDGVEGER